MTLAGLSALGEGHEVVAVLDDVDLLAAQLADDRLHARALHADAGADRIDVALAAETATLARSPASRTAPPITTVPS